MKHRLHPKQHSNKRSKKPRLKKPLRHRCHVNLSRAGSVDDLDERASQSTDNYDLYWDFDTNTLEDDTLRDDETQFPLVREDQHVNAQKLLKKDVISSLHSLGLDDHLIFSLANDDTPLQDAEKRKVTAVNRLVDFLEWVSDNCDCVGEPVADKAEYVKNILDQAILKLSVMLPGYVNLLTGMYALRLP